MTTIFASYPEPLTRSEFEVVKLVAQGLSNSDIANDLHKALDTVKTQLTSVYGKLGIINGNKRVQLIQKYYLEWS